MGAFLFGMEDFVVVLDEVTGKVPMERRVEPFCHDIGHVFLGRDIFDREAVVFLDLVTDPVVFDVHVARTFEVHDGSVCDVDRGLVVTEYELLVWKEIGRAHV